MGRGGGKKQHSKDPMHITATEWKYEWGGKKEVMGTKFKTLPFHCCAISLSPFADPWSDDQGNLFDIINIAPYIKKYKSHPITGAPMSAKDIFKVNFFKNTEGKYHCPVTYKVFTEHSHIVLVKPSGNVYAHEAVDQLNIKAKNWTDLLDGQPFTRKDIITIQDPHNADAKAWDTFVHIKKQHTIDDSKNKDDPLRNINANTTTQRILSQLEVKEKERAQKEKEKAAKAAMPDTSIDPANVMKTVATKAAFSTNRASGSFTSSAVPIHTKNEFVITQEVKAPKKKGYVRLSTNLGDLNIELQCDLVPKTCFNFLRLCATGYYDNTIFHRNIKHFMIQGGDPDGTGRGGKSIWGGKFEDEFKHALMHNGRGIVAMANSGKDTNGSQFYITYRPAEHLNNKHTVFGKVVGGMPTLDSMEKVPVEGKDDKPVNDIKILRTAVFVNPFDTMDADEEEERKKQEEKNKQKEKDSQMVGLWYSEAAGRGGADEGGPAVVGKYLNKDPKPPVPVGGVNPVPVGGVKRQAADMAAPAAPAAASAAKAVAEAVPDRPAKKPVQARGFDFSNW